MIQIQRNEMNDKRGMVTNPKSAFEEPMHETPFVHGARLSEIIP